jgi:exonuclease III
VGILINDAFLARMGPNTRVEWDELHQGRLAALRVSSPQGSLDIFVCYAHSGNRAPERSMLRRTLQRAIRPEVSALTVLAGDWNFVEHDCDRTFTKEAVDTGRHDQQEARAWQQLDTHSYVRTASATSYALHEHLLGTS